MSSDQTRLAAEQYFAAIGGRDADAFVALFSDGAHFEDPVGGPVFQGHEGVSKFYKGLLSAWQRLDMTVDEVIVRGNRAAVHWTASGFSATDKDIGFAGINVIAVDDDGLISRLEGFWDFEGVIGQM